MELPNKIVTSHIQYMLVEALEMATAVNHSNNGLIEYRGAVYTAEEFLERASNLASHAGQELMDEAFLAQGFPRI